jgi:hypothetical protein
MILFRDFVPEQTSSGGLFQMPQYASLADSLKEANEWIDELQIDVINVETVVLPNLHSPHEEGSRDPGIRASGEMSSMWNQFIRVWFRKP